MIVRAKLKIVRAPAILLGVALLLSFFVRIRLVNAPLERNEGEHLYLVYRFTKR